LAQWTLTAPGKIIIFGGKYPCELRGLPLAHRSAKVAGMPLPRIALSLILTLALAGAPVVQALAMAAASAPGSAGMHAGHMAQPDAAAAAISHNQNKNSCAQHDSCNGTCCANCAQCFTGVVSFPLHTDVIRPVLTPSVHRLSFSFLLSLRERPPRLLFV